MLHRFSGLPLNLRIAVVIFALVAAALGAALAPMVSLEWTTAEADEAQRRSTILMMLQKTAVIELANGDLEQLSQFLRQVAVDQQVAVALVADSSRRVVAASHPGWAGESLPNEMGGGDWRTVGLERTGETIGQLFVQFSSRARRRHSEQVAGVAVAMAIGGASAGLGASLLLGLLLTPRLAGLTRAVRRFGVGVLEARAGERGNDEVGRLAKAFDEMADRVAEEHARLIEVNTRLTETIAELEAAEVARLRSEQRYQLLLEHGYDGVVVTNREPRIIDVNRRFCELVGYSREELISQPYRMLVTPEELRRQPHADRHVYNGQGVLIERHYRRKDGSELTVELSVARVDEERSICIVRDITERRRAEEELARREREYRQLMEEAYDGIFVLSPGNRFLDANARTCELLGYSRAELLGRSYPTLIPAEDLQHEPPTIDFVFAGHRSILERRLIRADGAIINTEISATRVDDLRALCIVRDVTERKRAEAELARREREYRQLMEEAYDAILVFNRSEQIVDVNRSACDLLGYRRDELLGRPYAELIDPDHLTHVPTRIAAAFAGEAVLIERRLLRKNGDVVHLEFSSKRIDDQRVLAIARDVTDRRGFEAALRESEELSRTLLSAVFDGIVIHDNGEILEANPAYERMYGYSRDELIGHNLLDLLIVPESRPLIRDRIHEHDTQPLEGVGIRKDGRRIHYEAVGKTHTYRGRTVRVAAVRDITDRKEAEIAIRESERRLREAQEIAGLADWEWDPISGRVSGSKEMYHILGYEPDAFPATIDELLPFVHPDDLADTQALLESLRSGVVEREQLEFRYRRPDEALRHLHTRARIAPTKDGTGLRIFGTLQDVTERKELERQLAQAMKMEAVGKLTGGIAHDFNNLLTILVGNLRLMERSGRNGDPLLKEALRAAERGSDLVRRLLAFSRLQPLRPQSLQVNELIGEMVNLLERTIGEEIEMEVRLDPALWRARADSSQLATGLLNLALNARDAMPGGGRLVIATANIGASAAKASGSDRSVRDYVRLSVEDTGTGMTPEVLEHAFDPFFTTKEVGQGSGLGLSMLYGFAEQSGGYVAIQSVPQQGTTVALYLPKADENDASLGAPAALDRTGMVAEPDVSGDRRGQTILVVEDDADVRSVTVRLLKSLGYRVLAVGDGQEALKTLEVRPEINLVFSDVIMPSGVSGIDLASQVRQRWPDLPVLLTSGYSHALATASSDSRLRCPLLAKPYEADELERMLHSMLMRQPNPA